MKKIFVFVAVFLVVFFWKIPVETSMTGGTFELFADSFNVISTVSSTGGTFVLYDTLGEGFATTTSGGTFELRAGFQAMEQGSLSFLVFPSSVDLGALTKASVSSGEATATVSTNSPTGYSISLTEDGDFRSGTDVIDDVSDGEVTAGSEEYGFVTSGADALISSDTAVSNGVAIASYGSPATSRETATTFKASVTANTPVGSYSHIVTFTVTANL
jgi:hypothetical protein